MLSWKGGGGFRLIGVEVIKSTYSVSCAKVEFMHNSTDTVQSDQSWRAWSVNMLKNVPSVSWNIATKLNVLWKSQSPVEFCKDIGAKG